MSCVPIVLGDFLYYPQGNHTFLLLRYIHRAYKFVDNLHVLFPLSVYSRRCAYEYLVYKAI